MRVTRGMGRTIDGMCTLLGRLVDPGRLDVSQFSWERHGCPWDLAANIDVLSSFAASVFHRHRWLYAALREKSLGEVW